jgi:hypothetical protein
VSICWRDLPEKYVLEFLGGELEWLINKDRSDEERFYLHPEVRPVEF